MGETGTRIESVSARAYVIPTDRPEDEGTFAWTSTTLTVVEASAGGQMGLGYTYADRSITGLNPMRSMCSRRTRRGAVA
jgi:hypothetical protein